MPNRILRADILTSEPVCSLDWASEVFYRRLHSVVDDYGRHEAGIQLLRSKCYPLQTDDVRVADITRWMAACQKAGLIALYEVAGKRYLEVAKFGQQQRTASKFPPPSASDSSCNQLIANEHLGVSGVVSEDGGGKRATRIPPDFEPKPEPEAESGIDRAKELANFRDYWTSKARDNTKLDWQATWRQWARKADRPGVSRFAKPDPAATIPGRQGPDPELLRLKQDSKNAAPMPDAVREFKSRMKTSTHRAAA